MNRLLLPLLVSSALALSCSSEPTVEPDATTQTPSEVPKPEVPEPEVPEPEPEVPEPEQPRPDLPVIDELSASLGADGALGLAFAGRVGLGPVRLIEIELLDEQGQAFHVLSGWFPWLGRPNRFTPTASFGHLEADADTFRGFTTHVDSSLLTAPRRVRARFGERTELLGEPRETDVAAAAPVAVELGARCDPFQVLSHCVDGALCDVLSGVVRDSPTCSVPAETCPFDYPVLEGVYEGSNAKLPDETAASCTWSRGALGMEQGHVFTAPSAGTYRFVAESITEHAATTLFARRYCEYAHAASELGCAHESEHGDGPLVLQVPLLEGETTYVFVESWWANGGDYVLSVEPVE
jgi:hypothetical protein